MRLKSWIWDILQDGRYHRFDGIRETFTGESTDILYSADMFEPGGKIIIKQDDGGSYYMKRGWYVRKCHVEPDIVVELPKELLRYEHIIFC